MALAVHISGRRGCNEQVINGLYMPTNQNFNQRWVYARRCGPNQCWYLYHSGTRWMIGQHVSASRCVCFADSLAVYPYEHARAWACYEDGHVWHMDCAMRVAGVSLDANPTRQEPGPAARGIESVLVRDTLESDIQVPGAAVDGIREELIELAFERLSGGQGFIGLQGFTDFALAIDLDHTTDEASIPATFIDLTVPLGGGRDKAKPGLYFEDFARLCGPLGLQVSTEVLKFVVPTLQGPRTPVNRNRAPPNVKSMQAPDFSMTTDLKAASRVLAEALAEDRKGSQAGGGSKPSQRTDATKAAASHGARQSQATGPRRATKGQAPPGSPDSDFFAVPKGLLCTAAREWWDEAARHRSPVNEQAKALDSAQPGRLRNLTNEQAKALDCTQPGRLRNLTNEQAKALDCTQPGRLGVGIGRHAVDAKQAQSRPQGGVYQATAALPQGWCRPEKDLHTEVSPNTKMLFTVPELKFD